MRGLREGYGKGSRSTETQSLLTADIITGAGRCPLGCAHGIIRAEGTGKADTAGVVVGWSRSVGSCPRRRGCAIRECVGAGTAPRQ